MTRKILIICFLCGTIFGCKKTQIHYEYYPDGRKKAEYIETGNKTITKRYETDGSILQIRIEQDDKIISDKYFYKSGKLAADFPYKNGKISGIVKQYYENEALLSSTPYREGRISGSEMMFYSSGVLFSKSDYEYIETDIYFETRRYGNYDVFSENGKVISSGVFKLGAPWNGSFLSTRNNRVLFGGIEHYKLQYTDGVLTNVHKLEKPVIKEWYNIKDKDKAK